MSYSHQHTGGYVHARQGSPLSQGHAIGKHAVCQGRADRSSSEPLPSAGTEPTFSFQLALPRFYVPYRWWEDGASMILRAFDPHDIQRLIRFRLYEDDELPHTILLDRNSDVVSGFFALLFPSDPTTFALSHHQRVEEIVERCKLQNPFTEEWLWHPNHSYGIDPRIIASHIDAESSRQFKAVPFEDWIRYALGYHTSSIQWFFCQHKQLHDIVSAHLDLCPGELETYVEVERNLRCGSPFAQYVLLQCLSVRCSLSSEVPDQSNQWVVRFIIRPIQELFKAHLTGLPSMLRKLSVLSLSFDHKYRSTSKIEWSTPFEANPAYINDIFAFREVEPLARKLTHLDTRLFSYLSFEDFVTYTNSATLGSLTNRWHLLCSSTEICCIALPDMVSFFEKCIDALYQLGNYYSATAILNGLHNINVIQLDFYQELSRSTRQNYPQNFTPFALMDSTDNYAIYRQTMRERPGIPFLLPHLVEYRSIGEEAITDIFPVSRRAELCHISEHR